jgi:hypothetical protein
MNKSVNQFTYTEGDQYAPTVVHLADETLDLLALVTRAMTCSLCAGTCS